MPLFHPVDLDVMWQTLAQQERLGVRYGYGKKPPSLNAEPSDFLEVDCSGESRYLLYKSTAGQIVIPDGSQNQREFFEAVGLHRIARYSDTIHATTNRLFIWFIRPWHNGCGAVGHVWFTSRLRAADPPMTLESHGGAGVNSRRWNTPVLMREAYCGFELPCIRRPVA